MVHHSCYSNNSFEADWLQFGWSWAVCSSIWAALRGGFCEHSVISWLILASLKPFLRSACRTSTSVPSTTFSRRTSRWEGPGMVLCGEAKARDGFVCAFRGCGSAFGLWWNSVRNCRMIINLLSHLFPIIPKINIHLYQDLSSMTNVLPTEEGMLVSGITGTMYSSYLGCCANQINLASLSTTDTRPRYQTCGAHPCTNLAQEDDLSCCA